MECREKREEIPTNAIQVSGKWNFLSLNPFQSKSHSKPPHCVTSFFSSVFFIITSFLLSFFLWKGIQKVILKLRHFLPWKENAIQSLSDDDDKIITCRLTLQSSPLLISENFLPSHYFLVSFSPYDFCYVNFIIRFQSHEGENYESQILVFTRHLCRDQKFHDILLIQKKFAYSPLEFSSSSKHDLFLSFRNFVSSPLPEDTGFSSFFHL